VRTTALPTSSDRASSYARRIVSALSLAVGMVVFEIRPCARLFALKAAKVVTVRRREQGLLPSELHVRPKKILSERADLERGKFWREETHEGQRSSPSTQRDATTGCFVRISRSRDVAPAPKQPRLEGRHLQSPLRRPHTYRGPSRLFGCSLLDGRWDLMHVRCSTGGTSASRNVRPLVGERNGKPGRKSDQAPFSDNCGHRRAFADWLVPPEV
jgi:hypothetical protein